MNTQQIYILVILFTILCLMIYGRWRYDVVALAALLTAVFLRIVPAENAFSGFSHPAVITVAAVLIVSRGLLNSGLVDILCILISRAGNNLLLQMTFLNGLVAASSAFMNNVGALALFMPVAIRRARKSERSPSVFLMPLAFSSLLGGLITQVGTPPNIIISLIRQGENGGHSFQMFDFTKVGFFLALAGCIFIVLIGWRLLPYRKGQASREDIFRIDDYISEIIIPDEHKLVGASIRDLEISSSGEWLVTAHYRNGRKMVAPSPYRTLEAGDHLLIQASAEKLGEIVERLGLVLAEVDKHHAEDILSEEIILAEATIKPMSLMANRSVSTISLRTRYRINLLAVSRQGSRISTRLDRLPLKVGDVLLLQGGIEILQAVMPQLGLLPLAERNLSLGQPRRIALSGAIFGGAIIMVATGMAEIQIAFTLAALIMVLAGFVPLTDMYDTIEWPVIVLLGAMLPISQALDTSGGAQVIARFLLHQINGIGPGPSLAVLILTTMLLSNVVNNAAATLLMAPIAINLAQGLGFSMDPFLMAVAIGASCAFMTPIGHQSNTLVMGPGGYRFSDYWRLGLPLSIIILLLSVPLLLHFWPV